MTRPYPTFISFIDHVVSLNIILDPEWEKRIFKLQRRISMSGEYPQIYEYGGRKTIPLHRIVANTPEGKSTDHINGDPTDCRRVNLRWGSHSDNMVNRKVSRNSTSGVAGVSFDSSSCLWSAYIERHGKKVRKKFKCRDAAIAQRKQWEMEIFGTWRRK